MTKSMNGPASSARETQLDGLRLLQLESDSLAVTLLPEVGAKILTLVDKKSGRNLLWENSRIRPQRYPIDANFDNYWCGGWDDAYPTADACVHNGEPFPNLGELRSLDWSVDCLESGSGKYGDAGEVNVAIARLSAFGPITPVRATKTVTLRGQTLSMQFELENLGPLPLDLLWGTHPAFAIETGTRLLIPARIGIVAQSNDPSLGAPGDTYAWPMLNETDMSVVPAFASGTHCGHYATQLEDGWFAVETNGNGIVYEFPLEECPHLWMWLVYGGWRGYYHAVIEPWTGYPVNLAQAHEQGRTRQLASGGKFSVRVRCTTYAAPETHLEALQRLRD